MTRGRVVSIQVGTPRAVEHDGRMESTAIFKQRVEGPVHLGALGLAGDAHADTEHHGGPDKAVYAYPREHYAHWAARLPSRIDEPGLFGENLTTEGWLEGDVHCGDVLRVGEARLQVTSPRVPCFKLGIRTGDPAIIAPLLASGRVGFYLRVLTTGAVQAGDPIELEAADPHGLRMSDLIAALFHPAPPAALLERVLAFPALRPDHRRRLLARQENPE